MGRHSTHNNSEIENPEYKKKREKNNKAVKQCRLKSKQKSEGVQLRINELKDDNERLVDEIKQAENSTKILKELLLKGLKLSEEEKKKIEQILAVE